MARLTNNTETPISVLAWNQQLVLQQYLDDVTLQELKSRTLIMVQLGKRTGRHKKLLIDGLFNDAVRSDCAVQLINS